MNRFKNWNEYRIGTKAFAKLGGHWTKTHHGWRWCSGSTFTSPGCDVFKVIEPDNLYSLAYNC